MTFPRWNRAATGTVSFRIGRSRVLLSSALGCVCLIVSAIAGQVQVPIPETEVLAVGQIIQIYPADRAFQLRRSLPSDRQSPSWLSGGGIQAGPIVLGGGGVREEPIDPRPFPDHRTRGTALGDSSSSSNVYQTVFMTATTRIHQNGKELSLAQLRVGDRVTVRGQGVGDDIRARDVARGELIPGIGFVDD